MGATWAPLQYGETPLDHVRNLIPREHVVTDGTGKGDGHWTRVYYAAVREDNEVVSYITAYRKEDGGVVYKNFTERSLPYFFTAPDNVMAALTPTDNECAREWRAKVREQATKNYGPSRLRDGACVTFDARWSVGNEFVARKVGRTWEFEHPVSGARYRLRGWTRVAWAEA